MSGFGFSEEQEMFRRTARDFAQRELAPGAKERAKMEEYPREMLNKMGDAGLMGLGAPTKYGGQGADWVTLGIGVEELAKVDMCAALSLTNSALLKVVMTQCSEDLRQKYLAAAVKGECSACLVITEPHCGSDAAAIKTKAIRDGDYYIINGEKTAVTGGMSGDVAMFAAKTDPTLGARGVTFFLVPLDLPGISKSRIPDMGWQPMSGASLFFDDVRLPIEYRLSEEGKGFYMMMGQFDVLRVFLSLIPLGLAQASLEDAINYAKQRTAFGQPIARFEGVSFKIAEHATWIEAARLLCYRTLWLADQGLPHTKESAMCKWLCPVVAYDAIHDALLIHGHVAYSEEYPIEQRLRDTIGYEFTDGTAQVMKIIIARQLIGKEFRPY